MNRDAQFDRPAPRAFRRSLWMLGLAVLLRGASTDAAPESTATTRQAPDVPAPFSYDARGHRDPFIPLLRDGQVVQISGTEASSLSFGVPLLYGILWDPGGNSIALVNGTEVRVGDTIAGYKVAEIRQDAVVLTNGSEPIVLQISFEGPPDAASDQSGKANTTTKTTKGR